MLRKVIAVFAGLVTAWAIFIVIQALSHFVAAPPFAIDLNDPDSINRYMAAMPLLGFVLVLAGYAIGSFFGGFVIEAVARGGGIVLPVIAGGILMLAWILNLLVFPHPIWIAVIGFFMFIPFALVGQSAGERVFLEDGKTPDDANETGPDAEADAPEENVVTQEAPGQNAESADDPSADV